MKLHKALKLRKKLTGEIARLKAQIQVRNSYLVGSLNSVKYDIRQLESELSEKINYLIDLKCAINEANRKIQNSIYRLSEYKALILLWNSVSVVEGMQIVGYGEKEVREYRVQIDEKERDQRVKELQEKVDAIQEEIDVYNYTTEIVI